MSNFGPIIYDGIEEVNYGDYSDAPPEAVVEQVGRGNIEAWRALLERVGSSEQEFIDEVAAESLAEIDRYIEKKKSSGTVE